MVENHGGRQPDDLRLSDRLTNCPHVATPKIMCSRSSRSPHDVERNGLMRVAAKAFHFEIAIPDIDRVTERGRRLRRTLKAEHALVDARRRAGRFLASIARSEAAQTDPAVNGLA